MSLTHHSCSPSVLANKVNALCFRTLRFKRATGLRTTSYGYALTNFAEVNLLIGQDTTNPLTFNTASFIGDGVSLSPDGQTFTVSSAGVYQVFYNGTVRIDGSDFNDVFAYEIQINGVTSGILGILVSETVTPSSLVTNATLSGLVELSANDTITIFIITNANGARTVLTTAGVEQHTIQIEKVA